MRLVFANEATAARRRVYFHVVDATDGITAETGEAGGQPQVSSDGAAFTNTGIGTLTHLGNGRYSADLTQTLVATAGVSIETRYKSAATAETPGDSVQVVAFNPYSTSLDLLLAAANLSTDTITAAKIASDAITAAKIATGAITSAKFAAGAIDAAAIATDAIDADAIADNAINAGAIATGAITAAKFAAGAIDAAAIATDAITAAKIAADAIGASELAADAVAEIQAGLIIAAVSGTSDSGTTSTMVDAARTEADTDYWKGDTIRFTSGNIAGQSRIITGFNPATDTITFTPPTTQAVSTQNYEILPIGAVDVRLWNGSSPNNLVSNRVDVSVGAMATDVLTSGALATSAVTEIQTGLATSSAQTTAQNDLDDIQTRLPATLVGGRMRSHVEAMDAGVITAAVIATDAIDADALADGAITAPTFAAGAIDATAIATDAIGSAELAASAVNKIADQVWDELLSGHAVSGSTGEALTNAAASSGLTQQQVRDAMKLAPTAGVPANGSIDLELDEILSDLDLLTSTIATTGTADSGTTTTMVDAGRTEADADYWKGAWIKFTSGTISGQTRLITAFDAATDTITFTPATTQTVGTQTYVILASAGVDLRLWNGTAPNNLISGRVDSSTGAMAAGVVTAAAIATDAIDADALADGAITAPTFAAGAIDATAIATNAIGSAELASSAVDKIVDQVWDEVLSGHLTAGTTGAALNAAGSGASAATIADAVWDEARAGHVAAGSFGEGVASVQGNVTGSVASVTGNVGGNVTGSVGSIAAGGIAAASFAAGAIDSAAIATDAIGSAELAASAVNEIADQVWDEVLSGHLTAGTTGAALNAAGSGASAATIADAVWDEARAGHVAAGSFGEGVASVQGNVTGSVASVTGNVGGNVVGSVGSVAAGGIAAASFAAGAIDSAAIATDAIGSAELAASAVNEIADQVWDELIAGHLGAGSTGEALNNAAAASPSAAVIADAVWDEARAGHVAAGSFGEGVASVQGNVTGSVASVTGNVGGNVVGSVGSIAAGGLTAASTDATYVTEVQGAADAALVGRRLDELIDQAASPATPTINSFVDRITSKDGTQSYDRSTDSLEAIKDSLSGSGPTAAAIADAVWDEALADHVAAGSMGFNENLIDDIFADTNDIQTRLPATLSGGRMRSQVEGMDAGTVTAAAIATGAVDADALATDAVTEITTAVDAAITAAHGVGSYVDTGAPPTVAAIADGVWDELIAGHLGVGSTGAKLNDAATGGAGLVPQQVRDAMLLAPTGASAPGSIDQFLEDIQGPGFNVATDSLEEIRDEVDACCGASSGGDNINIEGI